MSLSKSPGAYIKYATGVATNLPGADLNAARSGPEGARPMDGPSNKANTDAA